MPMPGTRVAGHATAMIPKVLAGLDDEEIRGLIRRELRGRVESLDLASMAAGLLETITSQGKHREVLARILEETKQLLERNRPLIEKEIYAELPLKELQDIPFLGTTLIEGVKRSVAGAVANLFIGKIDKMLDRAKAEEGHPLRQEYEKAVAQLIANLRGSEDYKKSAQELKQQLLDSSELSGYMESLWTDLKNKILDDVAQPDSRIRKVLGKGVCSLADTLEREEGLKLRLNDGLKKEVADFAEKHRYEAAHMIEETVKSWDGAELSARLEKETGADLQFIRLNGMLVGGLAGLVIYLLASWIS